MSILSVLILRNSFPNIACAWIITIVASTPIAYYGVRDMVAMSNQATNMPAKFAAGLFAPQSLFSWLSLPADTMLVWGWMPQWFVYSGLAPASRETASYNQILQPDGSYFRARMLSDLARNNPSIVVDAVAPGSFRFSDPEKFGLASFPELNTYVRENFVHLNEKANKDYQCPALFLRRDRAAVEGTGVVRPLRVKASASLVEGAVNYAPERAFDSSVFQSCGDLASSWIGPADGSRWISIRRASGRSGCSIRRVLTAAAWQKRSR